MYGRESIRDLLRSLPSTAPLDAAARDVLAERAEQVMLAEGLTLVRQGEPGDTLYLLASGTLAVYVEDPERPATSLRKVLVSALRPGDFAGEISALSGGMEPATVAVVESSVLLKLPHDAARDLGARHPTFRLALAAEVTRRVRAATEALKGIAFRCVYERLAHALFELSEPAGDHRVVNARITHQQLAHLVGASRVMVTRLLTDLARDDHLTREDGRILLKWPLPQRRRWNARAAAAPPAGRCRPRGGGVNQ